MAPMSEYERRRAENIARNAQMLAQLGVKEAARNLKLSSSPPREKKRARGFKPEKKRLRDEPVVLRRSLRTKGIAPVVTELPPEVPARGRRTTRGVSLPNDIRKTLQDEADVTWEDPVPFSKVYVGDPDELDNSVHAGLLNEDEVKPVSDSGYDPLKLTLAENDVVRVVPGKILSLLLLPLAKSVVIAGDRAGMIGVWDADGKHDDEDNVVQVYQPHKKNVAAMTSVSPSKVASCSYDGSVLLMDIETAVFTRMYSGDEAVTALSSNTSDDDQTTLFAGRDDGEVCLLDARSCNVSSVKKLHEKRIHTIDCSPQRPYHFVTSSTDGTVSIWDVRNMSSVADMSHKRASLSAFFSPSGDQLVTTSYDNHVGLWSGEENDEPVMISHNNQTNRWIATFRAIWSCSDNYVFIANMNRAIDVICTRQNKVMASLASEEMTSIPSRLAQHRVLPGVVAGGTAGGKVFLWRS